MKKRIITIIICTLVCIPLFSQMQRMLIGDKIFNPTLGVDDLTYMPVNFKSDYSQNALFFANGDLAIYATDGKIYDWKGNLVTSFIFYSDYCEDGFQKPRSRGTGYSEFIFVKVPHKMNEFYAISVFSREQNNKINSILIFQKLKYDGIEWITLADVQQCNSPTVINFYNCDSISTECGTNSIVIDDLNLKIKNKINTREGYDTTDGSAKPWVPLINYSAYLEVSKEQINGKRYLFTNLNSCFHIFEIDSGSITIQNDVTPLIPTNFITSACDNEWEDYILNPVNNIINGFPPVVAMDIFNNYFQNYNGAFRGEMDLIQINNEEIRVAIPYFNIAKTYILVANIIQPWDLYSVTGVDVLFFHLVNGIPVFYKEEVVGIDTIYRNHLYHNKYRIIKGIEFSDNGEYLYVSSIKIDNNSNNGGILATQIDNSPILHHFKYDNITQCYPSWRENITALTPKIESNYQNLTLNTICNFDNLKVGSFDLKDSIQFGFGQIERDNLNRLVMTSENSLKVLADINNPHSNFSTVSFQINAPVFQNLLTAHTKNRDNVLSGHQISDLFSLWKYTYLLPDQITGEDYSTWFSPVLNLYPETLYLYPCTINPTLFTNTPHKIDFYKGTSNNSAPIYFQSQNFNFPLPYPLNLNGNYSLWGMYPSILFDGPVNKAIVTHFESSANECAGKEEIIIYDFRHPLYAKFEHTLTSVSITTTTSSTIYTQLDWEIGNNVYQIPNSIFNNVSQSFNVYIVDPNTNARLSLESNYNYTSYTTNDNFNLLLPSTKYEIEYSLCFNNCNGSSFPSCNVKSIFINTP